MCVSFCQCSFMGWSVINAFTGHTHSHFHIIIVPRHVISNNVTFHMCAPVKLRNSINFVRSVALQS